MELDPTKLVSHTIDISNYSPNVLSVLKRISQSIMEVGPSMYVVCHSWRVYSGCPICAEVEEK